MTPNFPRRIMTALRNLTILCLIVGALYGVFDIWHRLADHPSQPDIATPAAPAPQLADSPVEAIALPKPVKAYSAKAKKALKLPAAVQSDPEQHVLDAARIASSDRPQTVSTVLDTGTGETKTYVLPEPLPWLDTSPRGEAGLYLGIKRGEPVMRAQIRHQLLQVKSVKVGALASIDAPLRSGGLALDAFVGLGAWVSW